MKIKSIKLYNFGSYEGTTFFDFSSCSEQKRIVVFGGKNGAGKTTLFTAIQVGLYGSYAFGFRTAGKLYKKQIAALINNNAKLDEGKSAYVQISFSERRGNDLKQFTVMRTWSWIRKEIEEEFEVFDDDLLLSEESTVDFQNYLIHLIPPELMNLYFFDGESVVDAFLGENKGNIHDSLMTLSGNDTFEILYSSLRKLLKNKTDDSSAAEIYSAQKDRVKEQEESSELIRTHIAQSEETLETLRADLENLTSAYEKKGGVSTARWKEMQDLLREEEQKREELNQKRKQAADTILPFIMVLPLLERVKEQLNREKAFLDHEALKKALISEEFISELAQAAARIGSKDPDQDGQKLFEYVSSFLLKEKWEGFSPILLVSEDEAAICRAQISKVEDSDPCIFNSIKTELDDSIERSRNIRSTMEVSSVDTLEDYLNERFRLQESIESIVAEIHQLTAKLDGSLTQEIKEKSLLENRKKEFIQAIKARSVDAISGKVMLVVENLQEVLYKKLIQNVENDMNKKLQELMRKDKFWQEVRIDEQFNVHIICRQPADISALSSTLENSGTRGLKMKIGEEAFSALLESFHTKENRLAERLKETAQESIVLPMELGFERLSRGEKQVFVMSLYWAIMNQSSNEIPFIIDTPFARIDADHRDNITKHFFTQLNGQLFVLSTDEEIDQNHLSSMKDQIAELYMLEYDEDKKRTRVHRNSYFEV